MRVYESEFDSILMSPLFYLDKGASDARTADYPRKFTKEIPQKYPNDESRVFRPSLWSRRGLTHVFVSYVTSR
jgi:hypothetical protein